MTQAPATTVALAVRQHDGGRHPLNLLCTAPAGRLQDSRGGVINRRAEGATSSHPLPASCAAAAHPTTGVRRARVLSPSLRSQSCQHAQLVEGYGQSVLRTKLHARVSLYESKYSFLHGGKLTLDIRLPLTDLNPVELEVTRQVALDRPLRKECCLLYREKSMHDFFVFKSHDINLSHVFQSSAKNSRPVIKRIYLMPSGGYVVSGRSDIDCTVASKCMGLRHIAMVGLELLISPRFGLPPENPNGYEDGQYRANSLHPGSRIVANPKQTDQQIDEANKDWSETNSLAHIGKRETDVKFLVEHASLPLQVIAESLPAPCHHVQRGAA